MLPDLHVEPPTLEPSPLLLEQLAQLSRHSTPTLAGRGPGTRKAVMAAASATMVAGLSWLTGTLPGVASPFTGDTSHHGTHHKDPREAPATPGDDASAGDTDAAGAPSSTSATVPPGQAQAQGDNGNHTGQTKPHQNNGNHTGQTKPHQNNGNHTGHTKPHQDNGGQTGGVPVVPNASTGSGAVVPDVSTGLVTGLGTGQGSGNGTGKDHKEGLGSGT